MYLLELSSAPLCRRPQRQDRCGYSGSVCIHDRKPTAACPAAELTAMGSTSVFSPQHSLGRGKVKSNSTWLLLWKSCHKGSREASFEKCVSFPWKVLLLPQPYFCFPVDLEDFNIQFLQKCAYIFLTIQSSVGLSRNRVSACTVEIISDENKLNFSPEQRIRYMSRQDRARECWSCSVAVPIGTVRATTETSETPAFLRLVARFKQQKVKEMDLTPVSICNRAEWVQYRVVS